MFSDLRISSAAPLVQLGFILPKKIEQYVGLEPLLLVGSQTLCQLSYILQLYLQYKLTTFIFKYMVNFTQIALYQN